ncbi:MAG: YfiR family protein [Chloroflexi bacterium]|nr:MAG: YfiR family protein [Chloroflexota bacterium]
MALLSASFAPADRRRGVRRVAEAAILASALLLVRGAGLAGQTVQAPEYQVKAMFLFNFAQFVDWPAAAFADSATPLVIGVLGDDPFEGFLDQTIRREQVRGRGFQVQRYHNVGEIKTCHILFISRATGARLDEVLANLRNRPILTVSDDAGFAERGGMIRFVTDQHRIRLQINLGAAQAASLTVSSKLLRVADIVTPRGR